MRNIPTFTTENGVASLTLEEIPYTQRSYIRIHDDSQSEIFLKECCEFCKAAGAQHIFAAGHTALENYPVSTKIVRMSRLREGLPDTDAALFPVQEKTMEQWRDLYNLNMRNIPNSAYITQRKAEELLQKGNAYFVHNNDLLLGVGIASGEMLDGIISLVPGRGKDVLLALNHALSGERIIVEVATANVRAVRLYQKLGFIVTDELSTWYKIV